MPSYEHEGLIRLFRNRPELAPELLRDALRVELPSLRARLKCPACLLVVTPNESVAQWCREPIPIGPGNVFTPLVLGPASVPRVEDRATAERDPELAVLSVMAHGVEAESGAFVRVVLEAVRDLPDERRVLYFDLLAAVSDAARTALENLMASGDFRFHSEFAKRFILQGRAEGHAEGRVEGEAKGRVEGEAKGRVEGQASALIVLLEARGLRVTDEARARIVACKDPSQLDLWIRKAVSVRSLDELF